MWLLPLSNKAKSCGLYSFVFLVFINGSPLAFSCELCANSWKLASVYQKGKQTLSKTKSGREEADFSSSLCISLLQNRKALWFLNAISPLKGMLTWEYMKTREK